MVKVAQSSIVALFGTYQIAANGVAQSIWSLAALAGVTMGPVFITVIGQCMGSEDTEAADYYFKKLTKIAIFILATWNTFIFALTPVCDWIIRASIFIWRQRSGKWKTFQVI